MTASLNHPTNNDLWVIDLLNRKRSGFFVEMGALDGVLQSSTCLLEKDFEWRGVLIEPQEEFFSRCVPNRPRSKCFNVCCYSHTGFCDFSFGINSDEDYGHAGITQHIIYPDKRRRVKMNTPASLPCRTLEDILSEANAPATIDYLSLDTEGSELNILSAFDFGKYDVKLVSIEGHECDDLMFENGFKKVSNPHNSEAFWERYYVNNKLEGHLDKGQKA